MKLKRLQKFSKSSCKNVANFIEKSPQFEKLIFWTAFHCHYNYPMIDRKAHKSFTGLQRIKTFANEQESSSFCVFQFALHN